MSTQSEMDIVSGILGEVQLLQTRLVEEVLADKLNDLKVRISGISKEGVFERESLIDMRAQLRSVRSTIDALIPMKIAFVKDKPVGEVDVDQ